LVFNRAVRVFKEAVDALEMQLLAKCDQQQENRLKGDIRLSLRKTSRVQTGSPRIGGASASPAGPQQNFLRHVADRRCRPILERPGL